ncbi:hypothetical protein BRAS3843_920005 [Bradyrhizobium sp. STM 3843]|nr:hypothetical protein BRAS3843_920005 [Bradyrhizobium sp. STM 3843]
MRRAGIDILGPFLSADEFAHRARQSPALPLAKRQSHCYIGPCEAVTRVRDQHIPGALSIL